jgi:hypothetical protein
MAGYLFFSGLATLTVYRTSIQENVLDRIFKVLPIPSVASLTIRACSFSSTDSPKKEITKNKNKNLEYKKDFGF